MAQPHVEVMMALAFAGLGFLTAGLLGLVASGLAFQWRAALTILTAGAATGFAFAWRGFEMAQITLFVLALGEVPYLLLTSPGFATAWGRVVHRPAWTAIALCAVGLATVIGGGLWYDTEDTRQIDVDMAVLLELGSHPELVAPLNVQVWTDHGSAIPVKSPVAPRPATVITATERKALSAHGRGDLVIRTSEASDIANCHGWVYTGGRYWVESSTVETILRDNGYVPVLDPHPGDLAIYRNELGVCHTAVVRYVAEGQPALVEGKWGSMGIYLHRVNESVYGTNFTYYRSSRAGHLLAGLESSSSTEAQTQNSMPSP